MPANDAATAPRTPDRSAPSRADAAFPELERRLEAHLLIARLVSR